MLPLAKHEKGGDGSFSTSVSRWLSCSTSRENVQPFTAQRAHLFPESMVSLCGFPHRCVVGGCFLSSWKADRRTQFRSLHALESLAAPLTQGRGPKSALVPPELSRAGAGVVDNSVKVGGTGGSRRGWAVGSAGRRVMPGIPWPTIIGQDRLPPKTA